MSNCLRKKMNKPLFVTISFCILFTSCHRITDAETERIKNVFSAYKSAAEGFCACASDSSKLNCDSLNFIADWYGLQLDSVKGSYNLYKEWGEEARDFCIAIDSIGSTYINCKSTYYKRIN